MPINRMPPRSFATNLKDGDKVRPGAPVPVRGIAFGGDCGVKNVDVSIDGAARIGARPSSDRTRALTAFADGGRKSRRRLGRFRA